MSNTKIILYDCEYIYKILFELKDILNLDLINFEKKIKLDLFIKNSENFIVITKKNYLDIKNQIILSKLPLSIDKVIEKINLGILKYNFYSQSNLQMNEYSLDLNSREISYNNKVEKLTEQEIKILSYLRVAEAPIKVNKLQKDIWGFKEDLETHTVETHIHRLRKKIFNTFKDKDLIISTRDGYKLKKN